MFLRDYHSRGPVLFFSNLFLILRFVFGQAGKAYGISVLQKWKLVRQIQRNNRLIKSLSHWRQHLVLVDELLRLPSHWQGDVVECGCFNGASTTSLSLACALTNRRLFVCDSFEGLSEPEEDEKYEIHARSTDYYLYEKGDYSSEGGLEGVKENVRRFGNIDACHFVKGFFADTLPDLATDSIVMVFEDVDLPSAVSDCLKYLWPKMAPRSRFFCHEPWSIGVVGLFYDQVWWAENLNTTPPGFVGSGRGMVGGLTHVALGYATKFNPEAVKERGRRLEVDFVKEGDQWKGGT